MMNFGLLSERLGVESNPLADIRILRVARLGFWNGYQCPFVGRLCFGSKEIGACGHPGASHRHFASDVQLGSSAMEDKPFLDSLQMLSVIGQSEIGQFQLQSLDSRRHCLVEM